MNKKVYSNTAFVKRVFAKVPSTYERINHILTFGFDIIWRKKAVKIAASYGGSEWVDLCTGTGETAEYLSRLASAGTNVSAVDISPEMMDEAKKKPEAENINFIIADVKELPFEDNSVDLITMSFATRNINFNKDTLIKSFSEYHRILKSGGRFVNLETSQPTIKFIRVFFHLFIKLFVSKIGTKISGSQDGYLYLSKTIPRFYNAKELANVLQLAGFKEVTYKRMLFGIAAIHISKKD